MAALLLAAACSSSSGLERNLIEGGPGQPITVDISGVDNSVSLEDRTHSRQYTVQVEVGNSSDVPLTVTQILLRTDGTGAFQIDPAGNHYNEMIDPGKDHLFELTTRGRLVRPFQPNESRTVVLRVMVSLSNGDTYSYEFEGPVHDSP